MTEHPLDIIELPWVSSPYSLVSWWTMEQFTDGFLHETAFALGQFRGMFENFVSDPKNQHLPQWAQAPMKKRLSKMLRSIGTQCKRLNLTVTHACIEEALYDLRQEVITFEQIRNISNSIGDTMRREMQCVLFFYMPSKQAKFYRQDALFDSKVAAKYPSLDFDIREAGNCLAMGRSTACVFHLMRIMEVGTQNFGSALGITFTDKKNWQNILDESNKAIKALPKTNDTIVLSQVAAHLYNVKVAWRNQVMHPHDKYTLDEAEDLIGHVKAFMKTLSKLP